MLTQGNLELHHTPLGLPTVPVKPRLAKPQEGESRAHCSHPHIVLQPGGPRIPRGTPPPLFFTSLGSSGVSGLDLGVWHLCSRKAEGTRGSTVCVLSATMQSPPATGGPPFPQPQSPRKWGTVRSRSFPLAWLPASTPGPRASKMPPAHAGGKQMPEFSRDPEWPQAALSPTPPPAPTICTVSCLVTLPPHYWVPLVSPECACHRPPSNGRTSREWGGSQGCVAWQGLAWTSHLPGGEGGC